MVLRAQARMCRTLERVDGRGRFTVDRWERAPGSSSDAGGGGVTCVLQGGSVFEKAGVNVSAVRGTLPVAAAREMRVQWRSLAHQSALPFFACGISGAPSVPVELPSPPLLFGRPRN